MHQGQLLIESLMQSQMIRMSVSLDSEQEQQDDFEPETQPESDQVTPGTGTEPPQSLIELRIMQVHNRRDILLEMQRIRKKAGDGGVCTTEGMSSVTCKDGDHLCELEAVQKELEELEDMLVKMEIRGNDPNVEANGGQLHAWQTRPHGGIYMLPPLPKQEPEDVTPETTEETSPVEESQPTGPVAPGQLAAWPTLYKTDRPTEETSPVDESQPTSPVVPANYLGVKPEVTKCPFCEEVVVTETSSKLGETTWITCCICALSGGFLGCCLLPFFMTQMKDIHHRCPQCKAKIHTHEPL
ncbi:cell death-inducing p53-target protein 1 [Cottoperca gobio]|uniref:Cell death-inducing p53-target protein 1 n=1 Tax=Cottoperca gobio TaxID=56716 RepID=A0A6J2RQT4_COTGO|nr:lipopolysaccharide-induced tumor necrosis factor-alpha factor [Cottoperca gobio]